MNPFDAKVKKMTMMNPFTFETVNGTMDDGEHVVRNPFNCNIIRKVMFEGGKPIKAWLVNDKNEYEELLPYEDGTWDVNSGDK